MVKVDMLWQVTHLYSRPKPELSAVRQLLSQEDFQQCGLASAVVANEGNALSSGHLQVHVGKQSPVPKALGEIF